MSLQILLCFNNCQCLTRHCFIFLIHGLYLVESAKGISFICFLLFLFKNLALLLDNAWFILSSIVSCSLFLSSSIWSLKGLFVIQAPEIYVNSFYYWYSSVSNFKSEHITLIVRMKVQIWFWRGIGLFFIQIDNRTEESTSIIMTL